MRVRAYISINIQQIPYLVLMIIRDGTPPGFPRVTLLTYEQRIVARLITRAKLVGQNKTGLFAPSRMILHVCKRGNRAVAAIGHFWTWKERESCVLHA
jgi:hypothetical protein